MNLIILTAATRLLGHGIHSRSMYTKSTRILKLHQNCIGFGTALMCNKIHVVCYNYQYKPGLWLVQNVTENHTEKYICTEYHI